MNEEGALDLPEDVEGTDTLLALLQRSIERWLEEEQEFLLPQDVEWVRGCVCRASDSLRAGNCLWMLEIGGIIAGAETGVRDATDPIEWARWRRLGSLAGAADFRIRKNLGVR